MAIYNLFDLQNRISEMIDDEYIFANVFTLDADDEGPESLAFEAIDSDDFYVGYECVDSVSEEEIEEFSGITFKADDTCYLLNFTFSELHMLQASLTNAIEHAKMCEVDSSYSKDEIELIKSDIIQMRNLEAKIAHFFSKLRE